MFCCIREKTFIKSIILSESQKTSLYLYNPGIVIYKIQAIKDSWLVTPSSAYLKTVFLAYTCYRPKRTGEWLQKPIKKISQYKFVHLEYQLHIKKFVKSTIVNSHLHEITEQDVTEVQKQALAKDSRKKLNEKSAKRRRIIIVSQIKPKIQNAQ